LVAGERSKKPALRTWCFNQYSKDSRASSQLQKTKCPMQTQLSLCKWRHRVELRDTGFHFENWRYLRTRR
jgi:hypothetical protein